MSLRHARQSWSSEAHSSQPDLKTTDSFPPLLTCFSMIGPAFTAPVSQLLSFPLGRPPPIPAHIPRRGQPPTCAHTTVLIVPTGIGAAIGGYAGDALPSARLLASVTDTLITHPNVLNGALMYYPLSNALYVEGFALDAFAAGRMALSPPSGPTNSIGLVLDSALSRTARMRHIQAADAARATLGLRVHGYTMTDAPLGVRLAGGGGGPSWGTLEDAGSLLRAAKRMRMDGHVDAIAVVAQFPDDEDESALAEYRAGAGVDAIAGSEAVISHLVTRELKIPCAHAPALAPLDVDESVAPKAAAEELGYTFLSCVLVGLSRAPNMMGCSEASIGDLTVGDVDAVVVPADAFGGAAILSLAARENVLVIAVRENTTLLDIPPEAVGIDAGRVVWAQSYAEAAGFVAAHKAGIELAALTSRLPGIPEV